MTDAPRVLLVAKPWRGGLARYLLHGIEDATGSSADWLATHPGEHRQSRRAYARDRLAWRRELTHQIDAATHDTVVFLNPLAEFTELRNDSRYVAWLTDDPRPQLPNLTPYARVFISDPGYAADMERALGRRFAGVLPFACCARAHQARGSDGDGVCMVANKDSKRDQHLRTLFADRQAITVYGNYFLRHRLFWRHPNRFRKPIPNAALGGVYARYAISLNVHAAVVAGGTNMRTFECAAFGIPQVVDSREGLEELFSPTEELWTYGRPEDAAPVLREVMRDLEGRRQRASRARERVLDEHTYRHRAQALLSQ